MLVRGLITSTPDGVVHRHHAGVGCATEQVAFPMPRHGPILRIGGTLPDRDRINNLSQTASGHATLGLPQLPFDPQMRHQLFLQDAPRMNKQAAIDRFVRALHVRVGWVLQLQPAGDLLQRPLQRQFLGYVPS